MLKGLYGFLGRHGSYLLVYRSTRLLSDSVPIVNTARFRGTVIPMQNWLVMKS